MLHVDAFCINNCSARQLSCIHQAKCKEQGRTTEGTNTLTETNYPGRAYPRILAIHRSLLSTTEVTHLRLLPLDCCLLPAHLRLRLRLRESALLLVTMTPPRTQETDRQNMLVPSIILALPFRFISQ